jgi:hypothetical protein
LPLKELSKLIESGSPSQLLLALKANMKASGRF